MANHLTTRWALCVSFSTLLLAGCGGGGSESSTQPGTATIGPAGGTVQEDGGAKVIFPPEALLAPATVRIARDGTDAPPLPPAASAAGAVYKITPHGGALRAHALVTIPVTDNQLAATEQLVLVTAQPGDLQWTVLSGAEYANGEMRAPVMHFSYFQVVKLINVSMPSLVATIAPDQLTRSNNVGGPGVGRFAPGFEFDASSLLQRSYPGARVEARLTYPALALPTSSRFLAPPLPPPCLPVSYGHGGAVWRFLRNGNEDVLPVIEHHPLRSLVEAGYPRFDSEVQRYFSYGAPNMFEDASVTGMGALHLFGQNQPRRGAYAPPGGSSLWATPPAGNLVDDDTLTWGGNVQFVAEQHNGHMRIEVAVETSCNLKLVAVPISFRLALESRDPSLKLYTGVRPDLGIGVGQLGAAVGSTVVIPFVADYEPLSVRFEYSPDLINWDVQAVAAQYIRDDGRANAGHRYAVVIPNVQPAQAGGYRAWACSRPEPAEFPFPAVPSLCTSREYMQLRVATGPPVITAQPLAQTVQVGESALFDASAEYVLPQTVKWQKRPLIEAAFNVGSWSDIAGSDATFNIYGTPPLAASDSGTLYRAVFTSALGSTASAAALLTVIDRLTAPAVVAHPGSLSVAAGATAVFVATVTSAGNTSYQWQRNGVNLVGHNSAVLRLTSVSAANAGNYRLVVTNPAGSVTTNEAVLTVSAFAPLPPTITAAPISISVAGGSSANFAVGVSGTGPYTYRWQKNGTDIAGATAAGFGIASAASADAGSYSVRVTNAVGEVLSTAATLTVAPGPAAPTAPLITMPPISLAVLPGAAATFAVAATGSGPLGYQWQRNGVDIAGATASVLQINSASALDAGAYTVDVRNAAGAARSASVPLILIGVPAISGQPTAAAAVAGATARFTVSASGDALRYQWTRNGIAIDGATAASHTTAPLTVADSGAVYAAVVYNGAGVVFSQGAVLTVTAAAAQWEAARLIETDDAGSAMLPDVAVNAQGVAMAVWQQGDATSISVYASRYTPASGWGAVQRIAIPAQTAYNARVAIDASGNATAVWQQNEGSGASIWANRYDVNSGWGTAALIEAGAGEAGNPQVAVDPSGNMMAVWWQKLGSRPVATASRFVAGAGWGSAVAIGDPAEDGATFPQIAFDTSGNAMAVWAAAIPDGSGGYVNNIWSNRHVAGQGWATAVAIGTPATFLAAQTVQLALDAGGNALVVWDVAGGTRETWFARYASGSGWSGPALLAGGGARSPAVAVDTGGNAIAVWLQTDGTRDNVAASRYVPGAGWNASVLIETNNAGPAFEPQIAMDTSGRATVVWGHRNLAGFTDDIRANRFDPVSGWGTDVTIDGAPPRARSARVAVDSGGRALVVWQQEGSGGRTDIWATAFR